MTILDAEIEDTGVEEPVRPKGQYNAGDRRAVKAKEKEATTVQEQRDYVINSLLSVPNGRAWLAWVLNEICHVDDPLDSVIHETNALHWREGRRTVGLELRKEAMRVNKTAYLKMLEENP